MTGHTPGPWKWWTSNSWKRLKREAAGISTTVLEPYVCRDGHPDCTVSEADMHLIAAAPDLLKALRPLAFCDDRQPPYGVEVDDWQEAVHAARAAIAKALLTPSPQEREGA